MSAADDFRKYQKMHQVALNRSPEFCLKLTYRYLLKAGYFPVDTLGIIRTNLVDSLGDVTYQISRL